MREHYYSLGEYAHWKDTGCDLSPVCLQCHLPRCAEDRLRGRQKIRLQLRARAMAKMRRAGLKNRQIATAFFVATRTVERAFQRKKARLPRPSGSQ